MMTIPLQGELWKRQTMLGMMRRFCDELGEMAEFRPGERGGLERGNGCDPQDEKLHPGGTTEGDLCRLRARVRYLLELLDCESAADPEACCQQAYEDYCERWEACPV